MKSITFLNYLVAAIPLFRVMVKMSSNTIDDWFLTLAEKLEGNDELIEELASWLAIVPGFESRPVPYELKGMEMALLGMRDTLHGPL